MKFLIVANGFQLTREIILEAAQDSVIIALDGACEMLGRMGILPNLILGDLDSVDDPVIMARWGIQKALSHLDPSSQEKIREIYPGKYGCHIVHMPSQYATDLQKAILYCKDHEATRIDIVCAIGGNRMDHTLGNIRSLRKAAIQDKVNIPIYLHTESQTLFYVNDTTVKFSGMKGEHCGVMAFPKGSFTSRGLVWNDEDEGYPFKSVLVSR